jgi:adenine-specific DNA methylase
MVDCYRNLAAHMPDDGAQIVMFTHQNTGVWADLALILWAAGLRVTAAWTLPRRPLQGSKKAITCSIRCFSFCSSKPRTTQLFSMKFICKSSTR